MHRIDDPTDSDMVTDQAFGLRFWTHAYRWLSVWQVCPVSPSLVNHVYFCHRDLGKIAITKTHVPTGDRNDIGYRTLKNSTVIALLCA